MVQILYIIASLHVLFCPFTKVEESFNIQAFHDILYHRHNLSLYDHNEFPGVVPRTFLGPIILSIISSPIVGILHLFGVSKFWMQYVVRYTLALLVNGALIRFRSALQKQYGNTVTWWFTLITVTQYHFMFYMSRPLPNIMVLPLVLLSFEGWLSGKPKQFIVCAGAAIVIFRAELAMLFGLFLIIDLYFKKIDVKQLFKIAIPAGIGLIALTTIVDSIFWRRLLWPEAEVFWYNTILNKSSNWGTSPFLWYFYSALPRGLGPSLVLIPIGIYLDRRVVSLTAPAFTYILLYSFLPHKELRFIIYVFPLLNVASAAACSYVFVRRKKTAMYELLFWVIIVIVLGNILMSVAFLMVAVSNYPGGVAITKFHKLLKDEPFVNVHISNLAAQTGVTRFTQSNDNWLYNKNESLTPDQLQQYTHLIVEAKSKYSSSVKAFAQTHVILDSVDSFSHIAINYKLIPPIKIKTKPALFILERKDFHEYPQGIPRRPIEDIQFSGEFESDQMSTEQFGERRDVHTNTDVSSDEIINDNKIVDNKISEEVKASKKLVFNDKMPDPIARDEENDYKKFDNMDTYLETTLPKAKKALDNIKLLRQERKKKAIEKIKSETRNEVVASAKEKLREIMKRHKHVADELLENVLTKNVGSGIDKVEEETDQDVRGDIPEDDVLYENVEITEGSSINEVDSGPENQTDNPSETEIVEELAPQDESDTPINSNIDAIVEETIQRLIDRKIYDHKTRPEDITPEDRLMIQKIVEEVLSERMNYTNHV